MAGGHAVVIGGSIGGMCAARVLRRHFERVTVLDRDVLPREAAERAGVPQARHVHALMTRGVVELERLFPGFADAMRARGAIELDTTEAIATLRPRGWQRPMPTGLRVFLAARDLTESVVRERLLAGAEVEVQDRTEVIGLSASPGAAGRICGVRARSRRGGGVFDIEADLVVDASGRSSKAPAWLGEIGREPPSESVVDSFTGYSSRWFRLPDRSRWPRSWWWKGAWIEPDPPEMKPSSALLAPDLVARVALRSLEAALRRRPREHAIPPMPPPRSHTPP